MNVIRSMIPDVLIFEPKVLTDNTEYFYKSADYRASETECYIAWSDKGMMVRCGEPVVFGKDAQGAALKTAEIFV